MKFFNIFIIIIGQKEKFEESPPKKKLKENESMDFLDHDTVDLMKSSEDDMQWLSTAAEVATAEAIMEEKSGGKSQPQVRQSKRDRHPPEKYTPPLENQGTKSTQGDNPPDKSTLLEDPKLRKSNRGHHPPKKYTPSDDPQAKKPTLDDHPKEKNTLAEDQQVRKSKRSHQPPNKYTPTD